jgi:subtilase family serine protease
MNNKVRITLILSFIPLLFLPALAYGEEPLPDLQLAKINHFPSDAKVGDDGGIIILISNWGDFHSPESQVICSITRNGMRVAGFVYQHVPPLAPGKSYAYRHDLKNMKPGKYYVRATADYGDRIKEPDEDNNTKEYEFSVPGPDLIVSSITTNPKNPRLGQEFTVKIKIKNIGNAMFPLFSWTNVLVKWSKSSFLLLPVKTIPVPVGAEVPVEAKFKYLKLKDATITVTADNQKEIMELRENNNTKSANVHYKVYQ